MILRQLCQIRLRFLVQLQNELLLPGNIEARRLDDPLQWLQVEVHEISTPIKTG